MIVGDGGKCGGKISPRRGKIGKKKEHSSPHYFKSGQGDKKAQFAPLIVVEGGGATNGQGDGRKERN